MISPVSVWLIFGLALVLLELFIPGVILIFFGAAALVVSGLVALGVLPSLAGQILVFTVLSVILLLGVRRFCKAWFMGKTVTSQDTVEDDFIGQVVVVTSAIDPGLGGKIEFKGAAWSAKSDNAHAVGDRVKIVSRQNLTVVVSNTI